MRWGILSRAKRSDSIALDPAIDDIRLETEQVADLEVRDSAFGDQSAHVAARHAEPSREVLNTEESGPAVLRHDQSFRYVSRLPVDSRLRRSQRYNEGALSDGDCAQARNRKSARW